MERALERDRRAPPGFLPYQNNKVKAPGVETDTSALLGWEAFQRRLRTSTRVA